MKKIISSVLVLAMLLMSSVSIFANEATTSEKGKLEAAKAKVQLQKADELSTDVNQPKVKTEEKLEKERPAKISLFENKNLGELKAAFKAIKKAHEAKKELLAAIAKLKREIKDERIDLFLKGEGVDFDVPPVIKNGRTLIPVRAIMNRFDAEVAWDEATKTVTITKGDTVIKLVIGSDVALVNGVEVKLDVPAEVKDNRTLVPIRFIAETLKQKVEYDEDSNTIIIDDEATTYTEADVDEDATTDTDADTDEDATTDTDADTDEDATTDTDADADTDEDATTDTDADTTTDTTVTQ